MDMDILSGFFIRQDMRGAVEHRAKLVELIYSEDPGLLGKFISEADPDRPDNSHAAASVRIKEEIGEWESRSLKDIQKRAAELFRSSTVRLKKTGDGFYYIT